MSVNKKDLEKLSDYELEKYILPNSNYVTQAKIYAFEILRSRNKMFSMEEEERYSNFYFQNAEKKNKTKYKINSKIISSPFLLLFGLCGIFMLLMAIYFLLIDSNGRGALGGAVSLLGFITLFLILVVEQTLLRIKKFDTNIV